MAPPLDSLARRRFSATGKDVSVLGLGTVKFGRNQGVKYPGGDGFSLPSDGEISSLLDLCIAHGVNLLDTAPAYGLAEERLGALLGARRKEFFIVTKTGEEFNGGKSHYDFSAAHTRMSVARSLKRLRTDYLDCVLVHSDRDDLAVIERTPALETLERLKQDGRVLSYGVSTYTVAGGKRAAELADAVMVAYNQGHTAEKEVIDYAHARGKAVLVKKGLASGHVGTLGGVEENIRFILGTEGVTSLVFGSLSPANILNNIKAARETR
ncbi:MAG: aldo/keto reductase [Alphaproteobacteria bacterium]|nr:aldo/keto reductase [Alphaproteobacteria bacterium]MDE2336789.1 aldo/keto reductase [Alphaproteobacteria bacterium]